MKYYLGKYLYWDASQVGVDQFQIKISNLILHPLLVIVAQIWQYSVFSNLFKRNFFSNKGLNRKCVLQELLIRVWRIRKKNFGPT